MFLGLPLQMAIVTNVDWDHVDCYPTPAAYADAFEQFVGQLPASGHLVLSADGAGAAALRPAAGCEVSTYGLRADADWRAREVSVNDKGGLSTVVDHNGVQVAHLALAVAGQHNLCNALAAMAAADLCGVPAPAAAEILGTYRGAGRRFELVGEADGIAVIDDYGHHPTELAAVLAAARLRYPDRRLWAVFQPHTYSRLRALLPAFAASLAQADRVVLLDIYAAREADDGTVHSRQLLDLMPSPGAVHYAGTAEAAATYLLAEVRPGDVVITFSAGDGNQAGRQLLEGLRARGGQSSPPTRMRAEALQEEGEKAKGRKRPLPPSFSSTSPRSCPGEAFARPAMRCEERMDLAAALAALGAPAVADEPLARHTTFRIGGPAELFVTAGDSQRLLALARLATEHHWPVTVLGGGSNVLVSDDGIPGLVIASAARGVRELTEDGLPGFVADAGVPLAGLARRAIHHGWSGLEWAVCIPGTVGGAVIGNAGAHGGQVSDALDWAEIGWPDGRRERWQAADLRLGYRTSALKERLGAQEPAPIVLAAAFRLDHGDASALRLRADECLAQRRATQPVEPSAGSAFRNPPGDHAGRLIEACGLRGARLGGAQVSDRHANFIINTGTATAGEVAALIEKIRDSVRGKFALELQPEILFLGQWTLKP
jgi:UDP-N-acetylenolpyruvoylglucosamine reductase